MEVQVLSWAPFLINLRFSDIVDVGQEELSGLTVLLVRGMPDLRSLNK